MPKGPNKQSWAVLYLIIAILLVITIFLFATGCADCGMCMALGLCGAPDAPQEIKPKTPAELYEEGLRENERTTTP